MASALPFTQRIHSSEYIFDSLLRKSIRSIFLNNWVSDWILNNLSYSPFHYNHIISPILFNHAFSVLIKSRFQQTSTSNLFHDQYEGHQAFIPVLSRDDVTVGYCIYFASKDMTDSMPSELAPFTPPSTARFILDHFLNQLIIIIPCAGEEDNYFAIHSLYLNRNKQHTFIVEDKQYDWTHLPSHPSTIFESSTCSPQTKGNDTPFQTYINYQDHINQLNQFNTSVNTTSNSIPNPFLSSVTSQADRTRTTAFEPPPSSSFTDQSNQSSQSVQNISAPQVDTECTCCLEIDDQRRFKREMTQMFHGRATSVGIKIDPDRSQIPGYREADQLPNLHHVFHLCNDQLSRSINQKCVDFYYSQVLNESADLTHRSQPPINSNASGNES